MPPKGSASKRKATSTKGWSNRVDDFVLWGSDDEETDQVDDRPLLQPAIRAHTSSKSATSMSVVPKRRVNGQGDASVGPMREREEPRAGGFTTASSLMCSSPTPTDTVVQTTAAKATPICTARSPWQYTKTTLPQPVVPAAKRSVPSSPSVNACSVPPRDDGLPQYAFRKPKAIQDPTQQKIRAPFAEVANVIDTLRDTAEGMSAAPQRTPFKPPNKKLPSSSSSSSRRYDSTSATSTRMLPPSSPYTSTHSHSDDSASSSKFSRKQPSSQAASSPKRLAPARVTFRPGLTDQTTLAFTPVIQSTPRAKQSYDRPSSSLTSSTPATPRHSALPSPQSRQWSPPHQHTPQHPASRQHLYHSDGYDPEPINFQSSRSQRGTPRPAYHPMVYRPEPSTPSRSMRSAIEEAAFRETYQSFRSSPERKRGQVDCEVRRGNSSSRQWHSQARSEEERRKQQYPGIFNVDRDRQLKSSKQKLEAFEWNTQAKRLAVRDESIPSTPRQGAASRRNKALMALTTRQHEEEERVRWQQHEQQKQQMSQMQHPMPRPSTMNIGNAHDEAICISSGSSDEFDDFDMDGIREEDLARLEARQTM